MKRPNVRSTPASIARKRALIRSLIERTQLAEPPPTQEEREHTAEGTITPLQLVDRGTVYPITTPKSSLAEIIPFPLGDVR